MKENDTLVNRDLFQDFTYIFFSTDTSSGSNKGQIIGGSVAAGIILLILILVGVIMFYRWKKLRVIV